MKSVLRTLAAAFTILAVACSTAAAGDSLPAWNDGPSKLAIVEFVEAGGYRQPAFWTEEGQRWLGFSKAKMPLFWSKKKDDYKFRTMAQEIEMPWDWPAEVNYLEAKAFCNWKAKQTGLPIRLPSEAIYVTALR